MFAIFLMDDMDPFYQNISSFPTAIFTFLLAVTTLYWLAAVLGFVDLDFLDFELPEGDGQAGSAGPPDCCRRTGTLRISQKPQTCP